MYIYHHSLKTINEDYPRNTLAKTIRENYVDANLL